MSPYSASRNMERRRDTQPPGLVPVPVLVDTQPPRLVPVPADTQPPGLVPAPMLAQPPAGRVTPFPEINFDIDAFLGDEQPGDQLLQSVLDARPASVPVPAPVPVAAVGQSGQTPAPARRDELVRVQRLIQSLPRLPASALPPGVTEKAAFMLMLKYAVCQQRSSLDGNILIHKLAKRNDAKDLARYAGLMINFKHRTHVHTKNRHGETPLHVATGAAAARALLECGARVDARDSLGNTPIHLAARYQRVDVLAVLLERESDYSVLDMKNLEGYTALHLVVIHQPLAEQHRRALQLLIESGVDVNVADDTGGRSALFHAVLRGDELAVRELVENNAAVNMADFSETTPLQAAEDVLPADNNHICSILLERGGFKVPPADRVTQSSRRGSRRKAA